MPYGTVNADVIQTSTSGGILGAGNASIMKNRIINGAMVVNQRAATVTSGYSLDRWGTYTSPASKLSISQNTNSVTPPTGFNNYLGVTSTSAYTVTGTNYFAVYQRIEGYNTADLGYGTANAKTTTLSFWVQSSLTGTFGGNFTNADFNRSYPFTYTISAANTWEYKTVTIAGDTTGTWGTTTGVGIEVAFSLGVGSTYGSGTAGAWTGSWTYPSGTTSLVGTNGATFYITGVQLEVGSSATGYEYRLYNQELLACQRYFQSYGGSNAYGRFAIGQAYNTTSAQVLVFLKTTMRSSPSFAQTGGGSANLSSSAVSGLLVTSTAIDAADPNCCSVTVTASGGGLSAGNATQYYGRNSTDVFVQFSAEL